uniref:Ovule protein n=1 Tax=Ascaris lumbricoides TaxID=6252 RepID=A0A0M3I5G7_ASCLU
MLLRGHHDLPPNNQPMIRIPPHISNTTTFHYATSGCINYTYIGAARNTLPNCRTDK